MAFPNLLEYSPENCGVCPHCGTSAKFLKPKPMGSRPDWDINLDVAASEKVNDEKAPHFKDEVHVVVSECPACHS